MTNILSRLPLSPRPISFAKSIIPVALLFASFIAIIIFSDPAGVADYSPFILLGASLVAALLALRNGSLSRRGMALGVRRSASQILPAVPMLLCIAALATTWMLSGVVPTMVHYGLTHLNHQWFLVICCAVCAMVSVVTGSSWSTIATIGVAFAGIGSAMGYSPGWTAGAIISGAYFGDKVSPLSDTTVIASSTCNVDLFSHIRYMVITTVPAIMIAMAVFCIKGLTMDGAPLAGSVEMLHGIHSVFHITPWLLVIPAATLLLIMLRVPTLPTLAASAIMGGIGIFVFQGGLNPDLPGVLSSVWHGSRPDTGHAAVDTFISTGGILGIMPVVALVLSALVFGSIMIGSGMLEAITHAITRAIRRPVAAVGSTIAAGLTLNATTADQYLSIILNGNMYRGLYRRLRLEPRLLSRTLEDSISVTSPLIPWSSCGVTQASVLGISTLTYLPYCFFNYLTPVMSMLVIYTGFKVRVAAMKVVGVKVG